MRGRGVVSGQMLEPHVPTRTWWRAQRTASRTHKKHSQHCGHALRIITFSHKVQLIRTSAEGIEQKRMGIIWRCVRSERDRNAIWDSKHEVAHFECSGPISSTELRLLLRRPALCFIRLFTRWPRFIICSFPTERVKNSRHQYSVLKFFLLLSYLLTKRHEGKRKFIVRASCIENRCMWKLTTTN